VTRSSRQSKPCAFPIFPHPVRPHGPGLLLDVRARLRHRSEPAPPSSSARTPTRTPATASRRTDRSVPTRPLALRPVGALKRAITACNLGPKAPGGTPSAVGCVVAASIAALSVHLISSRAPARPGSRTLMALRLPDLGPSPRWQLPRTSRTLSAQCARPRPPSRVAALRRSPCVRLRRLSALGVFFGSSFTPEDRSRRLRGILRVLFSLASNLATISSRRWTWLRKPSVFSARASSIVSGLRHVADTLLPPADRQLFCPRHRPPAAQRGRPMPSHG